MSTMEIEKRTFSPEKEGVLLRATGLCLRCRHKITLCGKPFTATIRCNKCLYINEFVDSQQPVTGHE